MEGQGVQPQGRWSCLSSVRPLGGLATAPRVRELALPGQPQHSQLAQ